MVANKEPLDYILKACKEVGGDRVYCFSSRRIKVPNRNSVIIEILPFLVYTDLKQREKVHKALVKTATENIPNIIGCIRMSMLLSLLGYEEVLHNQLENLDNVIREYSKAFGTIYIRYADLCKEEDDVKNKLLQLYGVESDSFYGLLAGDARCYIDGPSVVLVKVKEKGKDDVLNVKIGELYLIVNDMRGNGEVREYATGIRVISRFPDDISIFPKVWLGMYLNPENNQVYVVEFGNLRLHELRVSQI